MEQDEEQLLSEERPSVISVNSEAEPSRPFKFTMELPLFVSIMSFSLSGAAMSNILLYRTCLHSVEHSKDECIGFLAIDKSNLPQQLEKEVQKYFTFVSSVKSVIEALAPAMMSLFLAVWSDTHGRKPLVVWPLFGFSLTSILIVAYSMFDNLGPWWFILTSVPYSLTGGYTVLFTGAFCYISDITTESQRTIRMAIMNGSLALGSVIGGISSSYVLRAVGNVYLLLIVATLQVAAYTYTNIWIPESLTGAVKGSLTSALDLLLVKETFRESFKRRANFGRAQILLLILANSLSVFILYGLTSLEYLYTRGKLHWTIKDFTIFSATHTLTSFFGGFFGVLVVMRIFRISDLAFANIAFMSAVLEYLSKALAVSTWHMYLGSAVSIFRGLSSTLIRSILTKILPFEDIAKIFALMSTIEGLCPLFAPVLYNSLYVVTISSFPSSIYWLSIFITTISIVCVAIVQYFRWNTSRTYQRLTE